MATDRCRIDQMAHVIMEGLQEYADLATEDMKAAVKKAGNKAKREVQAGAGRTRAFPHIAPAEEAAAELLEKEVEKALK